MNFDQKYGPYVRGSSAIWMDAAKTIRIVPSSNALRFRCIIMS